MAITWFAYGSIKIIKLQFPSLSPLMLLQTYGNSTPKELAWAFMGYSTGYNYFIGFMEYAIGLSLFFRRTSTLGSILTAGVLINVVVFNYSYDVNVKLLTTVLLAMALFLLSKDFNRLISIFFLNKTVYPANNPPFHFKQKWKNIVLLTAKYGFIIYIIFFDLHGDFERARKEGGPVKPTLYGIYNVTVFVRNKDTLKPLTSDTTRWNKLIISSPAGNAGITFMDDGLKYFVVNTDTVGKKILLYAKTDPSDKYSFVYDQLKDNVLVLHGKWKNDSLEIRLRQVDINKYRIMNSHFRWLIDRNFNGRR